MTGQTPEKRKQPEGLLHEGEVTSGRRHRQDESDSEDHVAAAFFQ